MSSVDFVRVEMLNNFDSIDKNILESLKRFPRLYSDVSMILTSIVYYEILINIGLGSKQKNSW